MICKKCGKNVELCNDVLWNGYDNAEEGLCSDCKEKFFFWIIGKFCEKPDHNQDNKHVPGG